MDQETSSVPYEIILNASPNEADIAITSVDIYGNTGNLNVLVLTAYGYDPKVLKRLDFEKGFDLLVQKGKKPILFIVTYGGEQNNENSLRNNLTYAIQYYLDRLSSKTIWIPLLGTGESGLSFAISLNITQFVIEGFAAEFNKLGARFIISIPDSKRGVAFFNQIQQNTTETTQKKSPKKKKQEKVDKISEEESLSLAHHFYISHYPRKFYLVSSNSLQRKKKDYFFNNNTWEKHDFDIPSNTLLKSVNSGDIVILKTTSGVEDDQINLIIQGFGIVTNNLRDGKTLEIDWKITDITYELVVHGYYRRNAIVIPELQDTLKILLLIKDRWRELTPGFSPKTTITTVTKINTIAGLISDSDLSTDHLNIAKDVSAFARVIAAKSFTPPLAIALFGQWGSGKSFFMKKLKERIKLLSSVNPEQGFCEGIAHVHFNAWSYMDANLWAGIITKIFDGLNHYIQNNSAGDEYKKKIEEVLTHKLNITHSELEELERKKGAIDAQLESLNTKKKTIEELLQQKIKKIKCRTMFEIVEQIDKEFKVEKTVEEAITKNSTFISNQEEFAKIVPRAYWKTPDELYNQTKSVFTFLKTFFKAGKWYINVLWLVGIIGVVLAVPRLLHYIATVTKWSDLSIPSNIWYIISAAGALYIRGVKTYRQLQPLVASFWNIKKQYELKKEDALFRFAQEEKALTLEIEQIKSQIIDINQQINQTTEQRAEIEFRLKNTLSTEALHSFIEKRSNSKEYEKHLGLISIIRKDFEILSNLFTDHHKELQNFEEAEEAEKFRENFERPLERIILYIDDLDRCPEERVVEVLEAVNLLMAYPLFVVVVGVDPRWVKNALIKKHQMHFVESFQSTEMEMIDPSSYLEKIFQVPFNLKAAEDESVKHMLKKLAETNPIHKEETPDLKEPQSSPNVVSNETIKTDEKPSVVTKEPTGTVNNVSEPHNEVIETKETIASLELSDQEIELLQEMSMIIGSSPRAIKRFVNIYRIIKAHEDFGYRDHDDLAEIRAVLLLLALPIGKFKKLNPWFEDCIIEASSDAVFADLYSNIEDHPNMDNDDKELSTEFKNVLTQKMSDLFNQKVEPLQHHYPLIKRFAYNGD
ncbi:P-loop NTPase fold protein [Aquimarina sp. 2304DJ70-9]|uniref:P-loop NTPase fold protein n=1 Tax=Aquimarina penaris TaxID=3231044 RepID=UPI003461D8EF